MVDGPFGSASEDFLNYETVLLVGAGIGVTPFASILKSIWYRMNNFNNSKPTRLSKVYFTWVIRDFGSAEWFHSLLHAIEEQDTQNRIEINIYLTAKIREEDMNNIIVQDVGAEKDAITSLRAPTHFGRPNWDRVFGSIVDKHPETDVGVFFCGPAVLSRQLHKMSNKYSSPKGTKFFFGKGASFRSFPSMFDLGLISSLVCRELLDAARQVRTVEERSRVLGVGVGVVVGLYDLSVCARSILSCWSFSIHICALLSLMFVCQLACASRLQHVLSFRESANSSISYCLYTLPAVAIAIWFGSQNIG